jgi:ABC-type lipoprotein export system ATPase subunit
LRGTALPTPPNIEILDQDDPLSVLDYQVGQYLVEEGFRKLLTLQGRTLILATHCLQLLPIADYVSFAALAKQKPDARGSSLTTLVNTRLQKKRTALLTMNARDCARYK